MAEPPRDGDSVTTIAGFHGEHAFLSNFHPSPIPHGSGTAPTVEHAFQARKTVDGEQATWVLQADTPGSAKKRGRRVSLRDDWQEVKLGVMEELLRLKFAHGSELAERLLATDGAELVEANGWNDTYWGVCRGQGLNHLGRLLMKVRAELVLAWPVRAPE